MNDLLKSLELGFSLLSAAASHNLGNVQLKLL